MTTLAVLTPTGVVQPDSMSPVLHPVVRGDALLDRIGNTPLVPIRRLAAGLSPGVQVFAKAEWFNPGGSVKDRPALWMIEDGERRGLLRPGKTILEATSGNTGIGLALIGTLKGYRVKLVMPANVTEERKGILRAYGAELILTDPLEGIDGAILEAQRQLEAESDPSHVDAGLYFRPDQYNNPANWRAHFETTGHEVWQQTGGQVTHFVAGIGTGGTLMGTGRRLKLYNPDVQVVAVEPADGLSVIEGLKHMETSIVPDIYDPAFPDGKLAVEPEAAHEMAGRLAREEGLFVGYSSGAAMWAALQVAQSLERGVVVAVCPDGGEKYLSLGNR
jgi:cysteine synthase B